MTGAPQRRGIAALRIVAALALGGTVVAGLSNLGGSPSAPGVPPAAGGRCVECHRERHPLLLKSHEDGPHASKASCEDCHGTDHDEMFSVDGEVSSARCGKCHEKAYAEFQRSHHGRLLRGGKMQDVLRAHAVPVAGCQATTGCHSVQRQNADGSVGQCSACHPAHGFSAKEARDPAVCARCHDAADHPAWRTWANDKHGVLYRQDPDSGVAPGCATCHMPGGRDFEEEIFRSGLFGDYTVEVDENEVLVTAEAYGRGTEGAADEVRERLAEETGRSVRVEVVPFGALCRYREVRMSKPILKIRDRRATSRQRLPDVL